MALKFLSFLEQHGIEYCVLSSLDHAGLEYDQDIDISIPEAAREAVAGLVGSFAASNGLLVVLDIWSGTHSRAFILVQRGSGARVVLKLDIMFGYASYGAGLLLSHEQLSNARVFNGLFWQMSPRSEIAFLAVRHFIKGDGRSYRVDRVRSLLRSVGFDELGQTFAPVILDAINLMSREPCDAHKRDMRVVLIRYGRSRMGRLGRLVAGVSECRRLFHRISRPVGSTCAFLGPDGCGKSTVIKALTERMGRVFHGTKSFYWRPRLLPSPGRLKFWNPSLEKQDNPDPHNVVPHGKASSLLRLLYFWIDYALGYLVVVRPLTVRKTWVVFDRYLNDIRVDQLRYRMNLSPWLLRLAERFAPKPDIVFALHGAPELIHARKAELSINEIERQIRVLNLLVDDFECFVPICIDGEVDAIVDETVEHILLHCARSTGYASGGGFDAA